MAVDAVVDDAASGDEHGKPIDAQPSSDGVMGLESGSADDAAPKVRVATRRASSPPCFALALRPHPRSLGAPHEFSPALRQPSPARQSTGRCEARAMSDRAPSCRAQGETTQSDALGRLDTQSMPPPPCLLAHWSLSLVRAAGGAIHLQLGLDAVAGETAAAGTKVRVARSRALMHARLRPCAGDALCAACPSRRRAPRRRVLASSSCGPTARHAQPRLAWRAALAHLMHLSVCASGALGRTCRGSARQRVRTASLRSGTIRARTTPSAATR